MALTDLIKKLFGSKADRDYKAIKPILDKVLAAYVEIDKLSDDDLRAHSAALRQKMRDVEAPFENRIAEIRQQLDTDLPISEKVKLADESEKLVKDEDEAIEKALMEILPEAFAPLPRAARSGPRGIEFWYCRPCCEIPEGGSQYRCRPLPLRFPRPTKKGPAGTAAVCRSPQWGL